jgi:uncharacterized protein YbaA (DUF1428 family)
MDSVDHVAPLMPFDRQSMIYGGFALLSAAT